MLIIMTGKSGVGKTTISTWLEDNWDFKRICIEEFRKTLFGFNSPSLVSQRQDQLLMNIVYYTRDLFLKRGYNVVIDTMSPTNRMRWDLLYTKETRNLVIIYPIVEKKYRKKKYAREFRFEEICPSFAEKRVKIIRVFPKVSKVNPLFGYPLDFTEIFDALEKDLELGYGNFKKEDLISFDKVFEGIGE